MNRVAGKANRKKWLLSEMHRLEIEALNYCSTKSGQILLNQYHKEYIKLCNNEKP